MEIKIKAIKRSFTNQRSYWAKTRIYVESPYVDSSHIDWDIVDEDTPEGKEETKKARAFNRAYMTAKVKFAHEALEILDSPLADSKLRYSRTAGCACGCSPAVVIDGDRTYKVDGTPADLFITVTS